MHARPWQHLLSRSASTPRQHHITLPHTHASRYQPTVPCLQAAVALDIPVKAAAGGGEAEGEGEAEAEAEAGAEAEGEAGAVEEECTPTNTPTEYLADTPEMQVRACFVRVWLHPVLLCQGVVAAAGVQEGGLKRGNGDSAHTPEALCGHCIGWIWSLCGGLHD